MNTGLVTLLTALLSSPVMLGLATGSLDPEVAGIRVGLALAVAMVMERLVRTFVTAAEPVARPDAHATVGRRADDGPRSGQLTDDAVPTHDRETVAA